MPTLGGQHCVGLTTAPTAAIRGDMPLDVLIVDDSAAIRKILRRVLVQAELPLGKVHEANDGREALEKMNAEHIGLVLADINMPNMDGIELLSSLKSTAGLKSVPVIMITTEGSQDRVLQAINLGAAAPGRKPSPPDQFHQKLGRLLFA